MKLTVIGYWGGYPASGGASPMYILEKDGFTLVLDLGSGGLMTFQQYKHVTDIDAVLLSHYHADHIADVGVLQHALLVESFITGEEKTVPIYGHIENREVFKTLNHRFTKASRLVDSETLKLGPFYIRFLRTKHSVPCYGMRITDGDSTIVYTADTAFQSEWIPFSRDADVLLADCNFYADQDAAASGHMTSAEAATIAKEANVNEIIMTHLPHFGDHNQLVDEAKNLFSGKVQLAYEGLTWEK